MTWGDFFLQIFGIALGEVLAVVLIIAVILLSSRRKK